MAIPEMRNDISPVTQGQALDLFCSGVVVMYVDSELGVITQPITLDAFLEMVRIGKREGWYRVKSA